MLCPDSWPAGMVLCSIVVNHIYYLLQDYLAQPGGERWYCASLVTSEGSSYRKPGAFMLVSPLGKIHGMVSGGCLESDIVQRAQKIRSGNAPEYVVYDTSEENSFAAGLGRGCNGKIGVLIQAIGDRHHGLLQTLYQRMEDRQASYLLRCFRSTQEKDIGNWLLLDESAGLVDSAIGENSPAGREVDRLDAEKLNQPAVMTIDDADWAGIAVSAPPGLWVLGGGPDAQPLVEIASTLGWQVSVVDHRAGYARAAYFPRAKNVINATPDEAVKHPHFIFADAFICMSHNKEIDVAWMRQLQKIESPGYVAILGPASRKKEVLDMAGVGTDFRQRVRGPAGLAIGGDMPESIALSIVAECHAALHDTTK